MATKELCDSQSALPMQIQHYKERIEVKLFEREGRKLVLTEIGKVALAYAADIFSKGKELTAILTNEQGLHKDHFRIGAVSTLSRNFQEQFLKPFLYRDDIKLVLQAGKLNDLLLSLTTHNLDVVLSNIPIRPDSDDQLQCRCIAKQKVSVIGKSSQFSSTFTFPQDLEKYPLLLPSKDSEIRQSFELLCETWEISPNIAAEADDMAMLRLLARDSNSVAILPKVVVKDELDSGLLQELAILPGVFENFYAITLQRKFINPLIKQLIQSQEPL